jgi:hypothetical protein
MTCDPAHACITCGDVGVVMRVAGAPDRDGLVACVGDDGERRAVDAALVGAVAPGDRLLVHADVALARVEEARA